MQMVATDGRRLAYIKRKAKGVNADMGTIIVPPKALVWAYRAMRPPPPPPP